MLASEHPSKAKPVFPSTFRNCSWEGQAPCASARYILFSLFSGKGNRRLYKKGPSRLGPAAAVELAGHRWLIVQESEEATRGGLRLKRETEEGKHANKALPVLVWGISRGACAAAVTDRKAVFSREEAREANESQCSVLVQGGCKPAGSQVMSLPWGTPNQGKSLSVAPWVCPGHASPLYFMSRK